MSVSEFVTVRTIPLTRTAYVQVSHFLYNQTNILRRRQSVLAPLTHFIQFSMNEIRSGYYRVSAKALILNESRDKFLICEEASGMWELPGGGLDWGVSPQADIPREIQEEMGLPVTYVAANPSYFVTDQNAEKTLWIANVVYETKVEHMHFTPSDECVNITFVDKTDVKNLHVFPTVRTVSELFQPEHH